MDSVPPAKPAGDSSPADHETLKRALDELGDQRLERTPSSPLYRFGMLLVALAMMLLPLVYLALVGAVGYLVYLMPTDTPEWAQDDYGDFGLLAMIVTTVGVIFVVFMVKPLFARPAKQEQLYKLKPGEAPELEDFVNRVADTVGAKRPREIELNCDVNAAAGFRRGLWSLFGSDLKLVIGLPLMAGMSLRAFGGVLAHEFGHFSQGAGMRLTYIIRVINAWFVRLVYQRDRLDAWLDGLARTIDLRIGIVLWTAKLLIWISRRVLWLLMYLGHGISCFALRQMEFDADRYEVGFAGSDQFALTSRRLQLLNIGSGRAMELLQETWKEGRISRNYPRLTCSQTDRLPGEIEKALDEALAEQKTGLLDTHPCDAQRIAEAEKLGLTGIFTLDMPASILMEDFDELCRRVTFDFYTIGHGLELAEHNLVANDVIGAEDEAMDREVKAIETFFGGQLHPERAVFFGRADVAAAAGDVERARRLCSEVKALSESLDAPLQQFDERVDKRNTLWMAQALKSAGFKLQPKSVGLSADELASLSTHSRACEEAIANDCRETLAGLEAAGRTALIEALAVARHGGGEPSLQAGTWLGWLTFFESLHPKLIVLQKLVLQQDVLIQNIGENGVENSHLNRLKALRGQQETSVDFFKGELEKKLYPFTHAEGDVSIWAMIDPKPPPDADPIFCTQMEAEALVSNLQRLYQRVLGQLAVQGAAAIAGDGGEAMSATGPESTSESLVAVDSGLAPEVESPKTSAPSD